MYKNVLLSTHQNKLLKKHSNFNSMAKWLAVIGIWPTVPPYLVDSPLPTTLVIRSWTMNITYCNIGLAIMHYCAIHAAPNQRVSQMLQFFLLLHKWHSRSWSHGPQTLSWEQWAGGVWGVGHVWMTASHLAILLKLECFFNSLFWKVVESFFFYIQRS